MLLLQVTEPEDLQLYIDRAVDKAIGKYFDEKIVTETPTKPAIPFVFGETLTVPQCADLLGIKQSKVYALKDEGILPYFKSGRAILFRKSEVEPLAENIRHKILRG